MLNHKVRALLVIFILFAALLFSVSGCSKIYSKSLLQESIITFSEENYDKDEVTIDLSEFTWFEWDQAIVFRSPISAQIIEESLNVEYNKSPDLVSGIVFVCNNQVVYEEFFESTYNGIDELPPRFSIYHSSNINAEPRYKVFTATDDVFRCTKKESSGYSYYVLIPET